MHIFIVKIVKFFCLTCIFSCILTASASTDVKSMLLTEQDIEKMMKEFQIPGFSFCLVKSGERPLVQGFGLKKNSDFSQVIGENTVFPIASLTKAFTSLGIALLVEQGKLRWDDKVLDYLPYFQLNDPYVTREMTIRDLLSHRIGLPSHGGDLLIIKYPKEPLHILKQLRYLPLEHSFRSKFAYNNLLYLAAGKIIESVTGETWGNFIKDNFIRPLGMNHTGVSFEEYFLASDKAYPHRYIHQQISEVPLENLDTIAPASAICSNANDMVQWLRLLIQQGSFEGNQILGKEFIKELFSPHIYLSCDPIAEEFWPGNEFLSYGLGFFVHYYHGTTLITHGGNTNGMTTLFMLAPEKQIGLVIMANQGFSLFPHALGLTILDSCLGVKTRDWSNHFLKMMKVLDEKKEESIQDILRKRVGGTQPSLSYDKYAGIYMNDFLGSFEIYLNGNELSFHYAPEYQGVFEHWHYDTFEIHLKDLNSSYVKDKQLASFILDESAEIVGIRLPEPFGNFLKIRNYTDSK